MVHVLSERQQEAQQNAWWLNGDSEAAKRARAAATFEERRDWLAWDWVQNSNNRTGVSVREAARREFGAKGILWNPNRHELLSDETLNLIQEDLRRVYEATQAEFRRRGITHVKLWRGVRGDEPKPARIHAFTSDPKIARRFGSHGEYHALVPVEQVLFFHEAEGWVDGVYGQQSEFLLMPNAPGESSGTPEFFVSRTKVAGKKVGWHASEGGAP